MSFLPRYHLPPTSREVLAAGPSAPPLTLCLDFHMDTPDEPEPEPDELESSQSSCGNTPDNAESPDTLRSKGSFNWDHEKGGFSLDWANLAEFDTWRQEEEHVYSIEFIASSTSSRSGGALWSRCQLFVCRCKASGGYVKKLPGRERKSGTRKSGCHCQIIIKQYPHTSTILGRYVAEHDHKVSFANIAYTYLSGAVRERIKAMLMQKIERHEIVSHRTQKILAAV